MMPSVLASRALGEHPPSLTRERIRAAAFMTKGLAVGPYMVKFEIWDTAGQERYHSIAPMYYREAAAALVVYDTSCRVCTHTRCPSVARCSASAASHAVGSRVESRALIV